MSKIGLRRIIKEAKDSERIARLEHVVLELAKRAGVAMNWETLSDLDLRFNNEPQK